MPVIARYNFDDKGAVAADSAVADGAQNGSYVNGAASAAGRAVLDGVNDRVVIGSDDFQLDQGTLEIQFSQASATNCTQTILSRDSKGQTEGGFRAEVLGDGAILITHESEGSSTTFKTAACFLSPCDEVKLSYSWDVETGGKVLIENLTTGATFSDDTPPGLTMNMGGDDDDDDDDDCDDDDDDGGNRPWIIGAGQSRSDPDRLNNIDSHFRGSVEYFQISNTVDNCPQRDGFVDGTAGNDLIDLAYTGDPDGDRIDNNDALLPGAAPNDDFVRAGTGDDTVVAGLGNDVVKGEDGDDRVLGGSGDDTLFGGDGDDSLFGGTGSDSVSGGIGDDLIETGSNAQSPDRGYPGLYPADGNPGDDRDTVEGGSGDDTITTGDDADLIYGGGGEDLINAGVDDDTIFGGRGEDTIVAGEGADSVDGGEGHDLIYGGLGPGFPDSVNIPDAAGDLRPDNGTDTLTGGAGDDTIFGLDDNDLIFGGIGGDLIDGGVDQDSVFGGTGNDTVTGGEGADSLAGGADRDLFLVGAPGAGIGDVIDGNEEGDDFDTLDLRGSGPLRVTFADDNPENGTVTYFDADGNETGTLTFSNIENIMPCFTPGTLVATPKGEVPVESLQPGDKIITRDNGIQEIRWYGAKHMHWAALCANPHLKPVRIRQGSLGNGLPEQDMLVSPNHRMLVANDRTALYFEEHEVLVAAKHLVGAEGIHAVDSAGVTYIHFMFDRHEVVLANGAWTESFQPGDYSLKGLGNAQRNEIFELFPELRSEAGVGAYSAARKTLKKHEASLLLLR